MHAHPRPQSHGEELANAVSHGLGFVVALAAVPALAFDGAARLAPRHPGVWVFAATLMLVYLSSALYHALPAGRGKHVLRRVDHAAIFLFIAGSYTPFALHDVPGGSSWLLLGGVWAAAALGTALKLLNRLRHRGWSTALYFAFGWLVLWLGQPAVMRMPPQGQTLLIAGGLAYTAGTVFFLLDERVRYGHLVWHLFVLAGSACHFLAVMQPGS